MPSSTRALCLGAAALALAACQSDTDQRFPVTSRTDQVATEAPPARAMEKRNTALVRFIHAVPEVAAVDLYGNSMLILTTVTYKTITPFQEVQHDSIEFRIRPSGQHMAEPLAVESEGIARGEHYTVAAFPQGQAAKADLRVFEDDLSPPPAGKAKLRVINGAADLSEIDVSLSGGEKPLFTGINFKSASRYGDVNPVTGSVKIHREGEKTPVLDVPFVHLEAGKIYTLVIVGRAVGTPRLEALTVEDRLGDDGR
ncbi:MAG: DUF4397 domain-containing protein [Planctomycetota bacterium]